jgi:methylmalonyl-CoA mutase N-terminal domain/subunit
MAQDIDPSLIADVFDHRHPSDDEREWAEQVLAPALARNPEQPIGAPTGINLDEHGRARFTTISGTPVRRLYTEADLPPDWETAASRCLGQSGEPP